MSSQLDLDQGGTSRVWVPSYMGPSIGWVWGPQQNVLAITIAGTFQLLPSTSLVTVNVVGAVTINMPAALDTSVAVTIPGTYVNNPITIVDIGGNAGAHNITIQPIQPNPNSETILGLTLITISVNYGGYVLLPNSAQKTWNSISP